MAQENQQIAMTTPNLTATSSARSSLIGAFLLAETYSIYASFYSQSLKPVRVTVLDRITHRSVAPGHIGDLQAVVNWHGFLATIAISIVLFGLAWSVLCYAARVRQASLGNGKLVQNHAGAETEVQDDLAAANA